MFLFFSLQNPLQHPPPPSLFLGQMDGFEVDLVKKGLP